MLLGSSISIQIASAIATTLFAIVSPAEAAAASFVLAGCLLLVGWRPRVRDWPAVRWRDVSVLGLTMAVSAVCFISSLDYLPLGTAVTLEFLGPLALALIAIRTVGHLVAGALALVGVVLVSSVTPTGSLVGLALAFGAGAGWAAYMLAMRRAGAWPRTGDSLSVSVCVAAVACSPLSIAAVPHLLVGSAAVALLGTAVLGKLVPYSLEVKALAEISPATAGIVFSIEPAIAALIGAIALGERMGFDQMLGVLAVVAAGILALRDSSEPPASP
jgi:inner membrane transporter RhtA